MRPGLVNSDILRRNNLNPLKTGVLVLRRQAEHSSNDLKELRQVFPCFDKVGVYLKQLFCLELNAGTIMAAVDYASDTEGVNDIVEAFKGQLIAYARGEYLFTTSLPVPANFQPLSF